MITIEKMTDVHLHAVHEIECHSFSDPWPMYEILHEINRKDGICLVAIIGGEVAGYAVMRHIIDEGHICNIATHEDHRQKGVGDELVKGLVNSALIREMVGLTLEVRIGNRAAMALYHKHGFKVEGYRREFYQYPTEDAAIMWKHITHLEVNK